MITVRYEKQNELDYALFYPSTIGMRHLNVVRCDGSQNTLELMARERIIYRASEANANKFKPLSSYDRVFHLLLGSVETVGFVAVIYKRPLVVLPFVTAVADRYFLKPWYPKGGNPFREHMEEGGAFKENPEDWRRNPFTKRGAKDPFYENASWNKTS